MKNELVLKELSTAELKEKCRKTIARCLTELRAHEIAEQKQN